MSGPRPASPGGGAQVRLSAGVALPQTLPNGSVMTFSVDYEFLPGSSPASQSRYVLVIQRPQGPPGRFPVELRAKDTLMMITDWPPSDGPFRAHLEDSTGQRISDVVDLR